MRRLAIVAALFIAAIMPAPAAADESKSVAADLNGAPIPISEIANHFCHDRDYPRIHCFASAAALDVAIHPSGRTAAPLVALDYVVVYSGPTYGGSFLDISQDYDTLAVVGWNDRIRSYRAVNNEVGTFWTDWFESGSHLSFCCNHNQPTLTATFDQQITSVYRN